MPTGEAQGAAGPTACLVYLEVFKAPIVKTLPPVPCRSANLLESNMFLYENPSRDTQHHCKALIPQLCLHNQDQNTFQVSGKSFKF